MSLWRRGGLGAGLGSWGRGGGEHSMALGGVLGEGWGPGALEGAGVLVAVASQQAPADLPSRTLTFWCRVRPALKS